MLHLMTGFSSSEKPCHPITSVQRRTFVCVKQLDLTGAAHPARHCTGDLCFQVHNPRRCQNLFHIVTCKGLLGCCMESSLVLSATHGVKACTCARHCLQHTLAPAMRYLQPSCRLSGKPCFACTTSLLNQGLQTSVPTAGPLGLQQLFPSQCADAETLVCPGAAGGHAANSQALPPAASWNVWWVFSVSRVAPAEARMLWPGGNTKFVSKLALGSSAPTHAVVMGRMHLKLSSCRTAHLHAVAAG